ncbi:hypothetical protein B0H10DRAFT_2212216 [Mycena sp. CBHHK59/15]|nr:hypothetical protein B0H10DRAFT_2212216 [Mycena sp. CBHHK59/15]
MKFSLFVALCVATTAFAATLPRGAFQAEHASKVISASEYTAGGNGTVARRVLSRSATPGTCKKPLPPATHISNGVFSSYLCTDANWGGYCVYITDAGPGECVNLASDLNDLVSSFGPDANQACYIFADWDCNALSGRVGPIYAPGVADMSKSINTGEEGGGRPFNDIMSSYQCFY